FFILLDRFSTHRLAPEACRWLVAFGSSSEAKRRDELKQFHIPLLYGFNTPGNDRVRDPKLIDPSTLKKERKTALTRRQGDRRLFYHPGLARAAVLVVSGAIFFANPTVHFCWQASHRQLNQKDKANLWYTKFQLKQPAGPWYDPPRAELCPQKRDGDPPKP